MHDGPPVDRRRTVLQNIGRNVLNLQKMEGMFKSLSVYAEFSGPIEDLAELMAARKAQISRKSLGQLVGEFIDRLQCETPEELEASPREVPWIDFRFTLVESEKSRAELESSLKVLVDERNALIHQKLLAFDIDSDESCEAMLAYLDGQHDRIRLAYSYLHERVTALDEMKREAQAAMLNRLSNMT